MSGTLTGGKAASLTNKEKYGQDYYHRIGKIGGSHSRTGGFYANRDLARRAGAIGGRISRRSDKYGNKRRLPPAEVAKIKKAYAELMAIHESAQKRRMDEGAVEVYDRKRGLVTSERATA